MNLPFRRPRTPLSRACPAYSAALDEYERLTARGDDKAAAEQWKRVMEITEIFEQGAEFARQELTGARG